MRVWALSRVRDMCLGCFGDFHVKADGQIFWRIAGRIVAGLVSQGSADHVFSGLNRMQGADEHIDLEIASVDIEFFVGSERKAHVLSVRVSRLADNDVGCRFHLESSRDEVFRLGPIGVDVVTIQDAEHQRSGGWFALNRGHHGRGR